MDGYTIAWIAWLTAFAVIEGAALADKDEGDTLSEHVRKWFATHTRPGRLAFAAVWLGFAGWFLVHIL